MVVLSPTNPPLAVMLALWAASPSSRGMAVLQGEGFTHEAHLPTGESRPLEALLNSLRPLRRVVALLPSPAAPVVASATAMAAGQAVLVSGQVSMLLVPSYLPDHGGAATTWLVEEVVAPVPQLSASQARREVQAAMTAAVDALVTMDLAQERPELADTLNDLVTAVLPPSLLPPHLSERNRTLLERSLRLAGLCELALADDGAASTASQARSRTRVLRPLLDTARRGVMAATDWWDGATQTLV